MEATALIQRVEARKAREASEERAVWRCGWCKGFIVMRRVSDMQRWLHEETPVTNHEVLPYRVG